MLHPLSGCYLNSLLLSALPFFRYSYKVLPPDLNSFVWLLFHCSYKLSKVRPFQFANFYFHAITSCSDLKIQFLIKIHWFLWGKFVFLLFWRAFAFIQAWWLGSEHRANVHYFCLRHQNPIEWTICFLLVFSWPSLLQLSN